MGNGIMVREASGAIVPWEEYRGEEWEDSGIDNIRPSFPEIRIVQGTSTMPGASKHGGDFWHSDSEEFTSSLEAVALVMRETRAMFFEGQNEPVCRSADAIAPLPNQVQWDGGPQPTSCETCPFSGWVNNNPPACKNSYVLLLDRGSGDLAQLRVSGKSIKPLRAFVSRKCAPKRLPLYAFKLGLSTTERAEEGKKWHELNIAGELMKPTEAKPYSDLLRAYRHEFETMLRESGEVPDESRVIWPEDLPGDVIDPATGEITPRASLKDRMAVLFSMPGMELFKTQFMAAVDHYKVTETTVAGFLGVAGKRTAWRDLIPVAYDWCEKHEKTANDLVVDAIDSVLNPPQKPLEVDDLPFT